MTDRDAHGDAQASTSDALSATLRIATTDGPAEDSSLSLPDRHVVTRAPQAPPESAKRVSNDPRSDRGVYTDDGPPRRL